MSTITTNDGTEIFYKDWGSRAADRLHHGWPLSADDWDAQMMFFASSRAIACIAHDRRGHGRSSQTWDGNEMDTYAADVAALAAALDLTQRDPHRPLDRRRRGRALCWPPWRRRKGRVAKAVLIGAVPPIMLKTPNNPGGLPLEVFDGFRASTGSPTVRSSSSTCRPARSTASTGPAQGLGRRDRQLVAAGHDGRRQGRTTIASRRSRRPTSPRTSRRSTFPSWSCTATTTRSCRSRTRRCCRASWSGTAPLKIYKGFPHGMCTTHADVINPDLLAFIQS